MTNILFYSKKCKFCDKLLYELEALKIKDLFTLYCVDDNINKIRNLVKAVPTIIVDNVSRPFVKKEAFDWIDMFKSVKEKNKFCNDNILLLSHTGYQISISSNVTDNMSYVDIDGDTHDKDPGLVPHTHITMGNISAIDNKNKITKNELQSYLTEKINDRKTEEKGLRNIQYKYINNAMTM